MVKLDHDHRAHDPIVKNRIIAGSAYPAEIGLRPVLKDFSQANLRVIAFQVIDVQTDQANGQRALAIIQRVKADARNRYHRIVLK